MCPKFEKVTLVNTNQQQSASPSLVRLQQSSSSPKFLHFDIDSSRPRHFSESLHPNDPDSSPEEPSFRADDFLDDFDDEPLQMNDNKSTVNGNLSNSLSNFLEQSINSKQYARIPEYSAAEENRNVRNFQCITLPDGKTREIDMKVRLTN